MLLYAEKSKKLPIKLCMQEFSLGLNFFVFACERGAGEANDSEKKIKSFFFMGITFFHRNESRQWTIRAEITGKKEQNRIEYHCFEGGYLKAIKFKIIITVFKKMIEWFVIAALWKLHHVKSEYLKA